MTKSNIQKEEKKSRYVFPDEFLKDIKANLTQEVAHDIASLVLSQIKAVNPDINLVIPNLQEIQMVNKLKTLLKPDLSNRYLSFHLHPSHSSHSSFFLASRFLV